MKLNRTIWAAAAAILVVLAWSTVAVAHARLEESDPAEGATITTPYTLRATFNEEINPDPARSYITISSAAGGEVARGTVRADDPSVMIAELPSLPPGTYTARWLAHTVNDDFTARGDFTFNVGTAASPAPTPSPTPSGGNGGQTGSGSDLLIALVVAGVVLAGVGAFVFTRMRR